MADSNRKNAASSDPTSGKDAPQTPTKSALASGGGMSPKHERTVSWGGVIPELKKGQTNTPKDSGTFGDGGSDGVSPMASPPTSNRPSSQKISLSDVVSSKPMEQEAQSHILRAVEKMQSGNYKKPADYDPQEDNLYRDIASGEITRDAMEKEKQNAENQDDEEHDEEKAERDPLLEQNQSKEGSRTSAPSSVTAKGKFKSLVQKNLLNKKAQENGVEHTLYGLTAALQAERRRKEEANSEAANRLADSANALAGNNANVENQEESDSEESDYEDFSSGASTGNRKKKKKKKAKHGIKDQVADGIGENWHVFSQYFNPKNDKAQKFAKKVGMFIILPSLGLAFLFYYVIRDSCYIEEEVTLAPSEELQDMVSNAIANNRDNPNITKAINATITEPPVRQRLIEIPCRGGASTSWWIIFLGVRQVVTFTMALITQVFIIDFLALGTRICLNWLGPVVTMFIVQSRGWPFLLLWWSVYDLILLSGDRRYAHHWAYWNDWLDIFNEENPSGNVVTNEWNYKVLRAGVLVGIVTSVKRLVVTLMLGKQTFARYGEELAEVMKNMMLIGEVATLARDIEKYSGEYADAVSLSSSKALNSTPSKKNVQDMLDAQADANEDPQEEVKVTPAEAARAYVRDRKAKDSADSASVASGRTTVVDEEFTQSEQMKLSELLDAWEEPETAAEKEEKKISIGAVLQFRQALTFMRTRYPFLPAFGLADTRERCIDNASKVFDRLMLRTPDRTQLPFDTLALLAKNEDEGLDADKAKLLIRIFRPDRDGNLAKLYFVKSIDEIYKSIKMLSANISNSSQIDKAVEKIINIIFYIILGAFVLSSFGVDPMQVFLSLSGLFLAFAFMFGSSSANFFEGVLFILVHAPYGVGDRVHFSYPSSGTSIDGSSGWIVERVALYTTSLYWGATNERCTINNGALSRLRVINSNRSPNAQIFIFMNFSIDTPPEKYEVVRAALEQWCKDRPREWLSFFCFRPTDATPHQNYVSYMTIATHRDKWQNVGAVLQSKSDMVTYQLEVVKAMGIGYHLPHQPVDVYMNNNGQMDPQAASSLGPAELGAMSQEG